MSRLGTLTRADLAELAPVLRRAVTLEPAGLARVRASGDQLSVLVRLPFGVLVARTIAADRRADASREADAGREADAAGREPTGVDAAEAVDATLRTADLLRWLDNEGAGEPERHDAEWRAGLPPARGWQRIDTVPDEVVRGLVRSGAQALKEAAAREGVPGAQPRAEVADALLDSVVLTVSADPDGPGTPITLRVLSALTRMGFLPHGSHVAVDVAGRWTRVAAEYGSVYAERPGLGLQLL